MDAAPAPARIPLGAVLLFNWSFYYGVVSVVFDAVFGAAVAVQRVGAVDRPHRDGAQKQWQ